MGLSRNKVAVSEGAAGSPPFYGESNPAEKSCRAEIERETINDEKSYRKKNHLLFDFQGPMTKRKAKPEKQAHRDMGV